MPGADYRGAGQLRFRGRSVGAWPADGLSLRFRLCERQADRNYARSFGGDAGRKIGNGGEAESGYTYASSTEYYDNDFQSAGVVYGEDGTKYTWYSQNVLSGGGLTELNENGRTVDDRGFVVDGDEYIAVSSSDYEQGTVLDTSFGPAKVYDTGCDSGVIDVYTDF